jgi:hypothetical protein
MRAMQLLCFETKLSNLMLKTQPKQLLGYLPLDIALSDPLGLLYGICDLLSIQMSFMRNIEPPSHDKKIEHLCDMIFRSCVSILINMKRCHPNCCQLQTSYLVKTPTLFSRTTFLNFAPNLTLMLSLSLSVSLVISSFSLDLI